MLLIMIVTVVTKAICDDADHYVVDSAGDSGADYDDDDDGDYFDDADAWCSC